MPTNGTYLDGDLGDLGRREELVLVAEGLVAVPEVVLVGHLVECAFQCWDERTRDLDVGDGLLVHRRRLRASDSSDGQHDDGDDAEDDRSSRCASRPRSPASSRPRSPK